jgi:hypothetical protein
VYGLFTARIHYATDEAWLITTSGFTRKAIKLARTTGVRLIDGVEVEEWLASPRQEGSTSLPADAPGSPARPVNPSPEHSEVPGSPAEAPVPEANSHN